MVNIDDCNNGMRARALKLKFGHDAVRILNARLSAWRNCVAMKSVNENAFGLKAFCNRVFQTREASLAAGLLLSPTVVRGAPLPDRHFSCGAYFALV
jgi:hypothetical protein